MLDIGQSIDLVVIGTPITTVPSIINECSRLEAGGAIIISSGGKEIGKKGQGLEVQ